MSSVATKLHMFSCVVDMLPVFEHTVQEVVDMWKTMCNQTTERKPVEIPVQDFITRIVSAGF